MSTDITLFEQPQIAPVYLQNSAAAKALAEQMEGGLAGRQINRIALRNGKFRFLKAGVEIASVAGPLPVVIIAANPAVGRMYYEKAFDPNETGQRPDCYSRAGVTPEADSPKRQSNTCALCPQNAKGSAKNGEGKACAYKKRTIVVSPTNIAGDAYALDAGSMSMFGDDKPSARLFNLKSYIEALKNNGLIIPAVVTQLSFDDDATVPKLHYTPIRVLTEAEFRQVEARLTDDAVRDMLDDVDLKSEEGKPVNAPAITAPSVGQPAAPAAAQPVVQPTAPVATTPAKPRGRPKAAETAPAAAPAPQTAPPAGFPPAAPTQTAQPAPQAPAAPTGFPTAEATAPAAQPTVAQGAGAVPGFSVDLDDFDA